MATKEDITEQKMDKKERPATKALQTEFLNVYAAEKFSVAAACRKLGLQRSRVYRWLRNKPFRENYEALLQDRIDIAEASLLKNIEGGDTASIIFFLKCHARDRGYVEAEKVKAGQAVDKKTAEILDSLIAGQIDAVTAGLRFSREGLALPEALRLLISKAEAPTPPPDMPPGLEDAELEQRYLEQLARDEAEKREWLPARLAEVAALKQELRDVDTWGPDYEHNRRPPTVSEPGEQNEAGTRDPEAVDGP